MRLATPIGLACLILPETCVCPHREIPHLGHSKAQSSLSGTVPSQDAAGPVTLTTSQPRVGSWLWPDAPNAGVFAACCPERDQLDGWGSAPPPQQHHCQQEQVPPSSQELLIWPKRPQSGTPSGGSQTPCDCTPLTTVTAAALSTTCLAKSELPCLCPCRHQGRMAGAASQPSGRTDPACGSAALLSPDNHSGMGVCKHPLNVAHSISLCHPLLSVSTWQMYQHLQKNRS